MITHHRSLIISKVKDEPCSWVTRSPDVSEKYTIQQFQMNRYISHWFLKWLLWYILNLYGKLHLLVQKFLQKDQFKDPKKGRKNVYFATFQKNPHFLLMNRYIVCCTCEEMNRYILCCASEERMCYHTYSSPNESIYFAPHSKLYRFIWRRICVIRHSFLKSVRFWRI